MRFPAWLLLWRCLSLRFFVGAAVSPTLQRESLMFKPGQKVTCIDDAPMRNDCGTVMPLRLIHGRVYTIRSIQTEPHIEGYGVRLEELPNPSIVWADGVEREWSYQSERFQALDEALALDVEAKEWNQN